MKPLSLSLFSLLFAFFLFSCTKEAETNKVPIVNAGPEQNITLYVDSVTLSGSASDTDGSVTAYLWSQVSGPATANIINPGSASTKVKGLIQGTYVFQLMATDDFGATGVANTSVVVNPPAIQTLTLQPANNPYEREIALLNGTDISQTGSLDIPIETWTINGDLVTIREALKFDLSSVPVNASIISANLYLYSYPNPTLNGNLTDANFGPTNSMSLQKISANWSPNTANWSNQPQTTTANQIIISQSNEKTLDLNIDVKDMVSSMLGGNNFGFFLRLQNETTYNSRIFVSSYNTTYPDKHPKLVVVYK